MLCYDKHIIGWNIWKAAAVFGGKGDGNEVA